MQPKKNPKVSLENKKAMFFQIGLAVTLLSILIAFEWKSYDKSNYNLGDLNEGIDANYLDMLNYARDVINVCRVNCSHTSG